MSGLLAPPPLISVAIAALYVVGSQRRLHLVGRRPHGWEWRLACFLGGLALILLVLGPAFDRWADELLWAHMLQHVVLMSFAPPLIVLGAPWIPVWRGLPLGARRPLARFAIGLPKLVRAGFRSLRDPIVVFVLASVDLAVWHLPAAYDLTLHSEAVHYTEHALFLALGLLFWLQVIESPPLHGKVEGLWRAGYTTAGAATGWLLALVLAFAQTPLYPAYAAIAHRPGGISALGDQELAAGVMIGIGGIPFGLAVFIQIYQWLDEERPRRARRQAPKPTRTAGA